MGVGLTTALVECEIASCYNSANSRTSHFGGLRATAARAVGGCLDIWLIINNSTTKQQKYDGAALRPNVGNRPTEETRQTQTTSTVDKGEEPLRWSKVNNHYGGVGLTITMVGKPGRVAGSHCNNYYGRQTSQSDGFALYDRVLCKPSVQAGLPFVSCDN